MCEHDKIRVLNDTFRRNLKGGRLIATAGVAGRRDFASLLARVTTFDEFNEDNDPNGEHDFGAFVHAGEKFFWKIDYYNASMTAGSRDPTDPQLTTRVLTITLAQEY